MFSVPHITQFLQGKLLPIIFFTIYLIIGLLIFKDYGIHWDEECSRTATGRVVYEYIFDDKAGQYVHNFEKYHGPAIELPLYALEKVIPITDVRQVWWLRHLFVFLLFYIGIICFFLVLKKYSHSNLLALGGCLVILLSPRLFAESFYNSKDVGFVAIFMIGMYTGLNFLEKPGLITAFLHAMVCGFLIDIRIPGVIMPMATILTAIIYTFLAGKTQRNISKAILWASLYLIFTILFVIVFWPILWLDPWYHFTQAWNQMSLYPWGSTVFYFGEFVDANFLPWHYLPVWMGITIPIPFLLLSITGLIFIVTKMFFISNLRTMKFEVFSILLFFAPILSIIISHSVIYDGWRHLYFLSVPLSVFCISGYTYLCSRFGKRKFLIHISIFVCFINIIWQMISIHPHQNVYFNILAGKNMSVVRNNFEMDYWGLCYKQLLEGLTARDTSSSIMIYTEHMPGKDNAQMLNPTARKRVSFTTDIGAADYYITNYRWPKQHKEVKEKFYSLIVDGGEIGAVYKLNSK